MELLKTAWISFLSIIVLFLLTKLMGNKQLSQLSMFDYIIGISIGSIAAECSFEDEHPERMIVAMIIYALSAYAVSIITGKSMYFRKVLIGRPLILFHNGKLYRDNFKRRVSTSVTSSRTAAIRGISTLQISGRLYSSTTAR